MRLTTIQNAFFISLLILTTLAFLGILQDFLQPLFWAAVLATLFYPVYKRWLRVVKGRNSAAALLTVLTIVLMVIVPLFFIGLAMTNESLALYDRVASGEVDVQAPIQWLRESLPIVTEYLDRFGVETQRIEEGVSSAAVTVSRFIATRALAIGQNALRIGIMFFLMLYVLFFFIRDGEKLIEQLIRALPLGDERERKLLEKFAGVSRATIKGTLVVGVVQGTIGGLMFWMLGINGAIFWGVIMTVLSLLPAVGSAIVWGPAAIILIATGSVVKGIILVVVGVLIIGLVDNVLRPILVGRDTKMPDYIILLATLGGLTAFGISGFVIGPVIAAFFLAIWQMFIEEYSNVDDVRVEPPPALVQPIEEPLPKPPEPGV